MARIRTIKPGFFRHESLYDAEVNSGLPLRIAFAGLWTAADREGRFKWQPRQLKLDCLPYDDVDFGKVLKALLDAGFIRRYAVNGVEYGDIPGWSKHQVINNREVASEIPAHPETEVTRDDASATRDDACAEKCPDGKAEQEQEREQEGKGEDNGTQRAREPLIPPEAHDLASAFLDAIGIDRSFIPPEWFGLPNRAAVWLASGWDRALILRTAAKVMDGRPAPPHLKYFEKAFANAFAEQSAPVPIASARKSEATHGKASTVSSLTAALDRHIERIEAFEGGSGEDGEAPTRLLSHG